jgi:hypothetical protein
MTPQADCTESIGISYNAWILILTTLCAFASLVIELQLIIETVKIINKLKDSFSKKKEENDNENLAMSNIEKIRASNLKDGRENKP